MEIALRRSCYALLIMIVSFVLACTLNVFSASADDNVLSACALTTCGSAAVDEQEPNDDFKTANEIQMNQYVYGAASSRFGCFDDTHDEDFYKVNLPISGSISITVVNDEYEASTYNDDAIFVYINNQYYENVDSYRVSTHTTRPNTRTISLSKGINYIRIHASQYNEPDHPYHFKLAYSLPSTSITKITPAKKKFTVKWRKKSGATSYQIRYSTKKSMSNAKTVTISGKSNSKKIAKLKAKKKYYVQVRLTKSIGGQTYYSNWSAKKSVKTK